MFTFRFWYIHEDKFIFIFNHQLLDQIRKGISVISVASFLRVLGKDGGALIEVKYIVTYQEPKFQNSFISDPWELW